MLLYQAKRDNRRRYMCWLVLITYIIRRIFGENPEISSAGVNGIKSKYRSSGTDEPLLINGDIVL
jgi:hypothetical protein